MANRSLSERPRLPRHLGGTQASGVHSGEPIAQFEIGPYRNFVYLIIDWERKKAAIVDPAADLSLIEAALKEYGLELTSIFLTHTHHDHIGGVAGLVKKHSGIELIVHALESHRLSAQATRGAKIRNPEHREKMAIGSREVEALHTPGHSAGECCYFLRGQTSYLLTGDTVFIRDCGRTDLETGSDEQMFESLQLISRLPGETVILPGHHYVQDCASILDRELSESPPFQARSVGELAALP